MRPPTVIDHTFRWDATQFAWVQDSTGMIVTDGYVEMAGLPITNLVEKRKRDLILEIGMRGVLNIIARQNPYPAEDDASDKRGEP